MTRIEFTRYCYPWHGEYIEYSLKVQKITRWLKHSRRRCWRFEYPGPNQVPGALPCAIVFVDDEFAVVFKMSVEV